MKTTLYVFSATGNSLTSANLLAKHLRADVIPVASTKHLPEITENSEAVGFVFPVYYGNMPYPVREMIEKMTFSEKTYVFTVATYRGHAGDVAKRMDTLLKTRGGKLSLALGLPMPGNSFINKPETDADYLAKQKENIEKYLKEKYENYEIIEDIGSGINYNKPGLQKLIENILILNFKRVILLFLVLNQEVCQLNM